MWSSFFERYGDHRDLHSCPTRRSSDLHALDAHAAQARIVVDEAHGVEAQRRAAQQLAQQQPAAVARDRKSTRLNSSHANISYAVFCLKTIKTRDAGQGQGHTDDT